MSFRTTNFPRPAKPLALLILLGATVGCTTTAVKTPAYTPSGTYLSSDGSCVYRTVPVYDREIGYMVSQTQRFCGGRLQIVR